MVPDRVRGLSPWSFGILFHHHFLVPSGFWVGSGACFPNLLASCSIIISWFLLVPGRVPGLVSLVFWHPVPSSFSWFHLVLGRVPAFVSVLFWDPVPSSFPGSFWFRVGFRGLSP